MCEGEEWGKVTLSHCSPRPHPHQPLQCGKVTPHPSTPFILPLQLCPLASPPPTSPLPIQNLLEINSKLSGA